jgi:RNA-directed DNA polymerase
VSGAYLRKFAWTKIARHQMVKGRASPDDPSLAEYWANRRCKAPPPPIGKASQRLLKAQDGRCPLCGSLLLTADDPPQSPLQWEQWLAATRKTITTVTMREDGTSDATKPRLVHVQCQRRHIANHDNGTALCPPASL